MANNPTALPTSPQVLREATPESISELFARDPENYSAQNLDRLIDALRKQRETWKRADELVASGGKRTRTKPALAAGGGVIPGTPEDLGL